MPALKFKTVISFLFLIKVCYKNQHIQKVFRCG